MDETKNIGLKPHRSHRGLSSKNVNLLKVRKKLMNVLSRDTDHLMKASFEGKLKESEASDLRGYLKLIRELIKQDVEDSGQITDADLRQKAAEDKA